MMKLSEFISILERVKKEHGDLPVVGECEECQRTDLTVWTLTGASEMEKVIIQVSSITGDE
jgi:hypothetical protein